MVSAIGGFSGATSLAALQERLFKRADADGDGSVTLEEFTANAPKGGDGNGPDPAKLFAEMDSDGDGSVSRDESDAFVAKRFSSDMQSVFLSEQETASSTSGIEELLAQSDDMVSTLISSFLSATDTDGDGSVSATEADATGDENVKKLFGLFDANSDGTVDETELSDAKDQLQQAFRQALLQLQESLGSDDSEQVGRLQGPPPGPPPGNPVDDYAAATDADGDGSITEEEATAADGSDAAAQVFDALDTNKDGTVDATELAAARDTADQFRRALLQLQEGLGTTAEAA